MVLAKRFPGLVDKISPRYHINFWIQKKVPIPFKAGGAGTPDSRSKMKDVNFSRKLALLLLFGLIAAATISSTMDVHAAESVTLQLYNPGGSFEVTQVFAPRAGDLSGKTICELSDGAWEDSRTFPLIRELLQHLYPMAKILPYTEFPHGSGDSAGGENFPIDLDSTAALVKQKGCQAVIVGNAG